jgi:RNA polymerase sigma-70 factor (ECF subfamily)
MPQLSSEAEPSEMKDVDLLRAVARERDRAAHRRLFDRYSAGVFVFVERRLGDRESAREVVSDVFLEVWFSASQFRGDAKVSSWIFGIARFKCLEAIRRRGRFKRSRVGNDEAGIIGGVSDGVDPGTRFEARGELERLAVLMAGLPPAQREALEWTVLDGLKTAEIAARQGVSTDTVKTRISRARKTLRRLFQAGAV